VLVFIVPLQSPAASKSWRHVSALALRSLRSILGQTHPDFQIFLVCNEPPIGLSAHPSLTILQRSFPVPDISARENRMMDKWKKVRVGLVAARTLAPCHIMIVDADDCVSNRLVARVDADPLAVGWFFDGGWIHDEGSPLIYRRRHDFDAICGTSSIVRISVENLPEDESGGREDNLILRSGHTKIRAGMIAQGTPLKRLPFFGAVYNLATGENDSSFSLRTWRSKKILLKKLLNYRLLTRRIRAEFGLYQVNKDDLTNNSTILPL
jgi:hypothetical protein